MKSQGFTGTQEGMTAQQIKVVRRLLDGSEFHFGDCIGADKEAYTIACKNGMYIIKHPPINQSKQAFCEADAEREPKEYLDRNHDIVDESDEMLATPKEHDEQLRSGTWATIRYARKVGRKLIIIYPDGSLGS